MRFLVCVMALGVLGCCFGPSVEAPPAPETTPPPPSALSQALGGMGVTDAGAPPPAPPAPPATAQEIAAAVPTAPPSAVPSTPDAVSPGGFGAPAGPGPGSVPASAAPSSAGPSSAAPASAAPASVAPSAGAASSASPACAEATAARDAVRAQLAQLRLTLGAQTSARLEAAGKAMIACDSDPACIRDGKARMARIEAYDRAKAAHEGERTRLAEAEVGLYDADRAVAAACGTP